MRITLLRVILLNLTQTPPTAVKLILQEKPRRGRRLGLFASAALVAEEGAKLGRGLGRALLAEVVATGQRHAAADIAGIARPHLHRLVVHPHPAGGAPQRGIPLPWRAHPSLALWSPPPPPVAPHSSRTGQPTLRPAATSAVSMS